MDTVVLGGLERLRCRFSRDLGKYGEAAAARHLRRIGYRILSRNVRSAGGEVDLVAEKDGRIAAVEVKTRRSERFGAPEEAVGFRKIRRMKAAATAYCRRRGIPIERLRLDVIAVVVRGREIRLRHHVGVDSE